MEDKKEYRNNEFSFIFTLLVELGLIPFNDSIHSLMTCKALYKRRFWYGKKIPFYRALMQKEYKKRLKIEQTMFWNKTYVVRQLYRQRKYKMFYNIIKSELIGLIEKRYTIHLEDPNFCEKLISSKNRTELVYFRFKKDLQIGTTGFNIRKLVHLLKRNGIRRHLYRDISQVMSKHGPSVHALSSDHARKIKKGDLGIIVYKGGYKKPRRGGKKRYNKIPKKNSNLLSWDGISWGFSH
jgi:hypothetical protein